MIAARSPSVQTTLLLWYQFLLSVFAIEDWLFVFDGCYEIIPQQIQPGKPILPKVQREKSVHVCSLPVAIVYPWSARQSPPVFYPTQNLPATWLFYGQFPVR